MTARPAAAVLVAAGLTFASWTGLATAFEWNHRSQVDAQRAAAAASSAEALALSGDVITSSGASAQLLSRAIERGTSDYLELQAALDDLPGESPVDRARTITAELATPWARVSDLAAAGDADRARDIAQRQVAPLLADVEGLVQVVTTDQARSERQATAAARAMGVVSVIVGSGAIALLVLLLARTRQLAAIDETRRGSDERLNAILSRTTDAVLLLDRDGMVTWASAAAAAGRSAVSGDPRGRLLTELAHPADRGRAARAIRDLLAAETVAPMILRLVDTGGSERAVELRGRNLLDDPHVGGLVVSLRDVSAQVLLEDQLQRLASLDPLTGVANRSQLELHAQSLLDRTRHGFTALLLVDIDDFRAVSDTLGHDAGDELLAEAARRLEAAAGDALVARLDGDTFAVLMERVPTQREGRFRADQVLADLRGRTSVSQGHSVDLDAHGGIAFGAGVRTARDLVRNADIALLDAKARRSPSVVPYSERMRSSVADRVELTGDLRAATENDAFDVHYQPIVELTTGRLVGMEALVRWTHPSRGRLSPDDFVLLAEQTGLIRPLGELVLRRACRDTATLMARDRAGSPDYVSVNISPRQLEDPQIVEIVASALDETGLDPRALQLELTEQSLSAEPDQIAERIHELRVLGVAIALDDFGAGYSLLSYLGEYPIDTLKIDRSLMRSVHEREDARRLLASIVEVSCSGRMRCVAEGIEDEEQAQRAREIGIELGQGFHFARPAPLAELALR